MNTHLMTTIKGINNFLNTNNEPPQDLLENLVLELEVSKLYIPAIHEDDHIIFEHLESKEGIKILPLYSSKENYSGDNELTANGISYYADIILKLDQAHSGGSEGSAVIRAARLPRPAARPAAQHRPAAARCASPVPESSSRPESRPAQPPAESRRT